MDFTVKKDFSPPQWKRISFDYNSFINNLEFALIDAAEKKLKCLYI